MFRIISDGHKILIINVFGLFLFSCDFCVGNTVLSTVVLEDEIIIIIVGVTLRSFKFIWII